MSCNDLNGFLTGSANASIEAISLNAEFSNTLNPKFNDLPANLSFTNYNLEGMLTSSIKASFNITFGAQTNTWSFHTYMLNGSLEEPVPLSLCANAFTALP